MMSTHVNENLWSIVLAGGEGERTRPFIEEWLGYHLPKQYCTFVGNRSMLQHTWDRAIHTNAPAQQVTVVARHHRQHALSQAIQETAGHVILQPQNRDTAAGIFLPLTYIRARNPHATVVIYPADHFVFPKDQFIETVQRAIQATSIFQNRIMLLGVRPTGLELEYGWIEPGGPLGWSHGQCVRRVHAFLEKPGPLEGLTALSNEALWNTFIMAANVTTLWRLGWKYMPEVMEPFQRLEHAIGTSRESSTLDEIYCDMPKRNFSSDLLARAPESVGVIELKDVLWSDWGRPERIIDMLRVIGKEPAFSQKHVKRPELVEVS
ncbi:sugar phosphate nucleotidyltransferase [Candidatus Nitrospira salsa]